MITTKILGYTTLALFLALGATGILLKHSWEARAAEKGVYEANTQVYKQAITKWRTKAEREQALAEVRLKHLNAAQEEKARIAREYTQLNRRIEELRREDTETQDWFAACDMPGPLFECLRWTGNCHTGASGPHQRGPGESALDAYAVAGVQEPVDR